MRILISAGPTWIKIDDIRIITNIFTGRTGLFLAEEFAKKRSNVTLLINPHCIKNLPRNMKVVPFFYFEELKSKLEKELKNNFFDVIIHTASVSDYKLKRSFKGKVVSGKKEFILKLTPTPKLIKIIRRLAKDSFLIQFKLEIKREKLIKKAFKSLKENKSDLVVANALEDLRLGYKAFVIDKDKNIKEVNSKKELFQTLFRLITLHFHPRGGNNQFNLRG